MNGASSGPGAFARIHGAFRPFTFLSASARENRDKKNAEISRPGSEDRNWGCLIMESGMLQLYPCFERTNGRGIHEKEHHQTIQKLAYVQLCTSATDVPLVS